MESCCLPLSSCSGHLCKHCQPALPCARSRQISKTLFRCWYLLLLTVCLWFVAAFDAYVFDHTVIWLIGSLFVFQSVSKSLVLLPSPCFVSSSSSPSLSSSFSFLFFPLFPSFQVIILLSSLIAPLLSPC